MIVLDDLEVVWFKSRPKRLPRTISELFFCVIYSPPNSHRDQDLIDHLPDCIDKISTKYPDAGISILGDFNHLDISQLLANPGYCQVVNHPTRANSILDKIVTNVSSYYNHPVIVAPIGTGDHSTVTWSPNDPGPKSNCVRIRNVRPMKDSAVRNFGRWITDHSWTEVTEESNTVDKCNAFYQTLTSAIEHFLPCRTVKLHVQDKPWITPSIKNLIHKRQSAFQEGRNHTWRSLRNKVHREITKAKRTFFHDR